MTTTQTSARSETIHTAVFLRIATTALALTALLVFVPAAVIAQPGGPGGHGPGMHGARHGGGGFGGPHGGGHGAHSIADRIDRLAVHLELSDSQIVQIESILEAHKASVEPIHTALKDAHEVISAARDAATVDEVAVRDAFASAGQARADLFFAHQEVQDAVHAVLTPAQLDQLAEMKDRRQERHERMKERRQERREQRRERHEGNNG